MPKNVSKFLLLKQKALLTVLILAFEGKFLVSRKKSGQPIFTNTFLIRIKDV
jgi:hypothetical protein